MSLLISALGICIGNLLVFSAIPFAWWLFRHRKEENFLRWVGIRKPNIKVKWLWLAVFAVVVTFIANGIAEEILFRGFFCKRLSGKLGSAKGVLLQAFLFGLMHFVLVAVSGLAVGVDFYLYEFTYTFLGALMLGLANEKLFDGSIWPSICLHGTGNFVSTLATAFLWW